MAKIDHHICMCRSIGISSFRTSTYDGILTWNGATLNGGPSGAEPWFYKCACLRATNAFDTLVILLTNVLNTISPATTTTIANNRSTKFVGVMSFVAGVN